MAKTPKGTLCRAKAPVNRNDQQYLVVYDDNLNQVGGKGAGRIPLNKDRSTDIGTFEGLFKTRFGVEYAYIRLKTPLTEAGKTLNLVYIRTAAIFAYVPTLTDYWVKTNGSPLRVRDKASTTTGKVLKSLANKTFAGRSDGTESNGFLYLTGADGVTKGWASRLYLTATKPATAQPAPPRSPGQPPAPTNTGGTGTGTSADVVAPPTDPPIPQKITIALENAVGTQNVKWVLWVAGGLLAVGLGLIVWKLVQTAKKKKK